jgi:uncharacterized repeat protein (TIGR01451 family)
MRPSLRLLAATVATYLAAGLTAAPGFSQVRPASAAAQWGKGGDTGVISSKVFHGGVTAAPRPFHAPAAAAGGTDYSLLLSDSPDPVLAGASLSYTITASNEGSVMALDATLTDPLPAGTTFQSLSSAPGWTCSTPPMGSGGTLSCSNPAFDVGSAVLTVTVGVDATVPGGTVLPNSASLASTTPDSNPGDTDAATETLVLSPALVAAAKTVSGSFLPGSTVTYTIVLSNAGPSTQGDNPGDELADVLPAPLVLLGASATSGAVVATPASNTVTWNGAIPAGGSVTITVQAQIPASTPAGTALDNQGLLQSDADGDGGNEASGVTDDPALRGTGDPTSFVVVAPPVAAEVPALDGAGLALLALALAGAGALGLRRGARA